MASHLPSLILDTILNIPHFLISIRNALLPIQPTVVLPPPLVPPPAPATGPSATYASSGSDPDTESANEMSETGSDADVESNSGEGPNGESWINLKRNEHLEVGGA